MKESFTMSNLSSSRYVNDILKLIKEYSSQPDFAIRLSDYHESDIAKAFAALSSQERQKLYHVLTPAYLADIISYMEDAHEYLLEMSHIQAAKIVEHMDADDAVDVLEGMEDDTQAQIVSLMDKESKEDVELILSYEEDEIGSKMTTNYIEITRDLSIRQAMHELVVQAGEHDNISTIYVIDEKGKFYGSIRLKNLIIAREHDHLESLIYVSGPYLMDHDKVVDSLERIKGYFEDSLPVLNDKHELLGIITSQDVVEVVDDELSEDYAKLAGLSAEEDLRETTLASMKKRLPWLIVLLFLGIGVSSVVGVFEGVVASLPIIMCFQSLILDMAGNVGTQSLAVTIRVLMDESLKGSQKVFLVFKEIRVGLCNGLFLGTLSFIFIGCYICFFKHIAFGNAFLISACVGFALLAAMIISSLVGTVVPLFFHKIHAFSAIVNSIMHVM